MCKRVPIENDIWVELETAIAERHLFDDAKPPRLSHGLCSAPNASRRPWTP